MKLPAAPYVVAKRVNGGHWISYGSYPELEKAREAARANRAFHAERSPKDTVEYSIGQGAQAIERL